MRILVWGTTLGKVADEAQFLSVHRAIVALFPDCEIVFLARRGGFRQDRYPNVTRISANRVTRWLPMLAGADLLIMLGGCFMEYPRQAANCLALFLCAKLLRRPVVGYGTTVFPYRTAWGRTIYRFIFNGLDAITAREQVALEVFEQLGVRTPVTHLADPRFILPPADRSEVDAYLTGQGLDPAQPLIGISTRHMHDGMPDWVKRSHGYTPEHARSSYQALGEVVDRLAEKGQVFLLPMASSPAEDAATADLLRAHMTDPARLKVPEPCRASELLGLIGACDMIVASRLGAALFATVTATPTLAVAYEARMVDHMQRIGQAEAVVDWRRLREDDLGAVAERVWADRDAIRRDMKTAAAPFVESAWKNGDMLRAVLANHAGAAD